jgi:translation elongation factor EF-1alpha
MDVCIGQVTHYFNHIGVAVVQLSGDLKVGETILIAGHAREFTQPVASLEIDHRKVDSAGPGAEVAMKVAEPVHKGDKLFKVAPQVT